ncbi:Armadillo-type fold [Ostreococcus tauri]|uniref:Armadillo-type fold n=1 Tax=Ostreococcus tauri TaxID=70448 RepID=Q01CB1_OSTTA|nr:Armadillo-type fold [Ostreococcus tauri]CAL53042.1 Armadillo-type fold [Ostreococcus tauri]|eukprot:XP_003078302.1 Armadillo-type fold [Ostreococcus tauri]
MRLTSQRFAGAELLDDALRDAASTRDVALFHAHVADLETLHARAVEEGTWAETSAAARCLKTITAGFALNARDVDRAFELAESFARHCIGVDDDAACDWCSAALALVDRFGEDVSGARVAWALAFATVESFIKGDATGYQGFGSVSGSRLAYVKVVRKSRRFFEDGSARAIWARVADQCRETEHNKCFEGIGLLQLFMPCMKMSQDNDDATFFVEMMRGEWRSLSRALGSSTFWMSSWMSIFSQLAKHDIRQEIEWSDLYNDIFTTTLKAMELPIGGIEGRHSFGRKMSYRTAMTFGSSVEPPRRMRSLSKFFIYRAMIDSTVVDAIEKVVDYIEHFYHPSSSGSFIGLLAHFLRYNIKYMNKFLGDENRRAPPDVLSRLVTSYKRLTDRALFSKSSDLRRYANVGVGRLAYIDPGQILPGVMSRFEDALAHETATRQLVPALNCLTICVRPMMLLPANTVYEGPDESYVNISEFLASAMNASIPGIDVNDSLKTCATLRFFSMVIMNLPRLIDAGEPGAVSHVQILWSDWTIQFLARLFVLFEHLQPDTHGSKSDAADAFKGAAREASGFLLSASSMYRPLLRMLFTRLDPSIARVAIRRVAAFIRENMFPEVCEEIAILVQATMLADPELAYEEIIRPMLKTLDDELIVDGPLSTTTESRIFWCTGIVTKCAVMNRDITFRLVDDFKRLAQKVFKLGEKHHNLDVLSYAELMITTLLQGLTTVEAMDQYKDEVDGDSVTNWVCLKWNADDSGQVIGDQHLPSPFEWRLPNEAVLEVTRKIIDEFLLAPANELLEAPGEDSMDCEDDPSSAKDMIRTKVSMLYAVLNGLEEKLQDFEEDDPLLITGHVKLFPDVAPRALVARALVAAIQKTSSDDTETLNLICSAAESTLNPSYRAFMSQKKSLTSLNSTAFYFTQPRRNGTQSRYPRWFIAEKVMLGAIWRNTGSSLLSRSSPSFHAAGSSDPDRAALVAAVEDLSLSKYASVRSGALPMIQALSARFPRDAVPFVEKSTRALATGEKDEDKCIAACDALQNHFALGQTLRREQIFVPFIEALLGSSHHGTDKAQNSIGSLFLCLALMFSRGLFHPVPRASLLPLKERMILSLKERCDLHWSYEMMTNAITVFFIDPHDDASFLSTASEIFMASVVGDLKVVRFPAMCALLMMSRYECFESSCAPQLKQVMSAKPEETFKQILTNFAIAHSSIESGEGRGRSHGKSDMLMQAAESLYGFANEMAGPEWPNSRAADIMTSTGAFIVAVARFWKILAQISPADVAVGVRATIREHGEIRERSMRCALAEALAGVLASRCLSENDRAWMHETFFKYALDAPPEQREEWLKGAAFCTDSGGNISDDLLRHLSSIQVSTMAQLGRSLEITRVCVAQLWRTSESDDIKLALLELLADPMSSPLSNDSRLVRESAAQLAATLLADRHEALSAARAKLILLLTADIENITVCALASDPAHPDPTLVASRNALEGIFYTFLEMCRRGDILEVASCVPVIVRAALRTAEAKDKEFAMVAKLTGAYLKYPRFSQTDLQAFTGILQLTLCDANWHTRAATLRYIQALIYHHAFTIESSLFVALRAGVIECLKDRQLEVAQLASQTLMIFFKGIGLADASTLRSQFLEVVVMRLPRDATQEAIAFKHAAVLGLSACVLSHPYDVPSWMPEAMEALSFAALEPSLIKQTTQRTFAEFKKTHQDTWSQTRAAFTHEQWENITLGLDLAPSYII